MVTGEKRDRADRLCHTRFANSGLKTNKQSSMNNCANTSLNDPLEPF